MSPILVHAAREAGPRQPILHCSFIYQVCRGDQLSSSWKSSVLQLHRWNSVGLRCNCSPPGALVFSGDCLRLEAHTCIMRPWHEIRRIASDHTSDEERSKAIAQHDLLGDLKHETHICHAFWAGTPKMRVQSSNILCYY